MQIEKSQNPRSYLAAIRDTGAIRHFHTIEQQDGSKDSQSIETELSKIESGQCKLIRKIERHKRLSAADKRTLIEFVSVMRVRIPSFREYISQHLGTVIQSVTQMLGKDRRFEQAVDKYAPELPNLPEPILKAFGDRARKMIEENQYDIEISNQKLLSYMFQLGFNDSIIQILMRMEITFVKSPQGVLFVTSDQPVAVFNPHASPSDTTGSGLLHQDIELTFPLTSNLLVRLDWSQRPGIWEKASVSQVEEYNRRTIIMAQGFVYSSRRTDELVSMVAEHAGFQAGSDLSSRGQGSDAVHITSRVVPVCKAIAY